MARRTIQMRLGKNYGELLVNTAREHLLCDGNIEAALKILYESIGCDEEQAKQLLHGEMFLEVCDNGFELDGIMYDPEKHTDRTLFDFNEWCKNTYHHISEEFKVCKSGLNKLMKYLQETSTLGIYVPIPTSDLVESVINKSPYTVSAHDVLSSYGNVSVFSNLELVEDLLAGYLPKALVVNWLYKNFPDANISPLYLQGLVLLSDLKNHVDLMRGGVSVPEDMSSEILSVELDRKISSDKEINETIAKGIEPVDIKDNYTSGWLSPEGEYYALNGVVSNMLHNTIADALLDKGVIPQTSSNNPDKWLEANGWVKIQGENILYCGWLGIDGSPIIPMTLKQKRIIANYGKTCHDGFLKVGFYETNISATKFGSTEIPMLRQYFT